VVEVTRQVTQEKRGKKGDQDILYLGTLTLELLVEDGRVDKTQ
jgi:hypothetical protein